MAKHLMCQSATKIYFMIGVILFSFGAYAQDELNDGPGILSGEKGQFSLSNLFEKKDKVDEKTAYTLDTTSNAQEFNLYKQWTQSKSANDATYQEFKLWLQYQEYLQLQKVGK
jgi:hypothetical protein